MARANLVIPNRVEHLGAWPDHGAYMQPNGDLPQIYLKGVDSVNIVISFVIQCLN